jgi:hypothetical protein
MTLEQKLLIISKAVQKHGIAKLARRIVMLDTDIMNPSIEKIDEMVESIIQLERNWKKLKRYIKEHGIIGTAALAGSANRYRMRYINYFGLGMVIESLDYFETDRFYEMMKLDAAIPTA